MTRANSNRLAVVIAVVVVAAVLGVSVGLWRTLGDTSISAAGWLAMAFGIILTVALGVGLMALGFISSRRGYDEPGRGEGP